MHVKITVKKYKLILGKQFVDVECIALSDSLSDDLPTSIFVMLKLPKNALQESTARFSHIADPVDLEDYPDHLCLDAPYFRTNEITLRVRNDFQAARIISVMLSLVQNLKTALTLSPISELTFTL